MKIKVYNIKAEEVGEIALPKIFSSEKSNKLIAQSLRVFRNNQRKSHAKAKDRGDISGTSAKMWPQKGTGRARHSTSKAPQFVGGASAHGPQGNQNFKLSLPKSQRKAALSAILSLFAKDKKIIVIDKFSDIEPKTKIADKLITGLMGKNEVLSKSRHTGIILCNSISNVRRAFNNISDVKLLNLNSLNVFDLSKQDFLIFSKKALNDIK